MPGSSDSSFPYLRVRLLFRVTDSLSTTRLWGWATREHLVQVQQDSLFRIASVTKPITSVTIFSLLEQGKLKLTDKVFGPGAICGIKYGKPPYKQ